MIWLTRGQFTLVDDEDYERFAGVRWHTHKSEECYYARNSASKGFMHRLILGISEREIWVDHRDGNGLNNQKYNLRISTRSQNGANRRLHKQTSSKYLGVSWNNQNQRWMAKINKNRTEYYLGNFKNETEAAIAYNKQAVLLHGEFAKLNII